MVVQVVGKNKQTKNNKKYTLMSFKTFFKDVPSCWGK